MTQIIINETTPIVVEVSTPGPQGSSGTVAVGTVTTGASGSAAAVTNSGTPSAAVFNFTIPKGDVGDVTPAATAAKNAAEAAATAAQASSTAAQSSSTSASASATAALNSANQASASASTASTKAQEATTSANNASNSAQSVLAAANTATTKAQEAATSASNALSSANTASTKAQEASASEVISTTKAQEAVVSATTATNAATSASASAASALLSKQVTTDNAALAIAQATIASTKATQAAASEAEALAQAGVATNQAAISTAQAVISSNQASIATTQAAAALASAQASAASASTSSTQAGISTTQAAAASASASNAALSATAAANAQTTAAASATTATTQATAATAAKTAAETARDAAIVAQNNAVAVVTGGTATLTPQAGKIPLADGLGKIAKGWLTNTDLVEQTDIGTAPNEIPLNQYLGEMAYMDANTIPTIGVATANLATANVTNLMQVTEISTVMPTLNLDFAKVKQLDPRITFTRASTGTYYDGKTRAKAEENLLTFSEQFDNAVWIKSGFTVTANAISAPDGTITADTLTCAGSAFDSCYQTTTTTAGAKIVLSFFLKAGTKTTIRVGFLEQSVGGFYATVDLTTGVFGSVDAGITAESITAFPNGWYRVAVSRTFTSSRSDAYARLLSTDSVAGTLYVWGAQLEQRSAATAYTPTTTQPITNYIPQLMTAAAGVPRFEHNPITGESLGLEIEEQRTNLCLQSEDFGTTWVNTTSIDELNVAVSPSGTLTADKLYSTAGTDGFISQAVSIVSGTVYTSTVYAKDAGFSVFRIIQTAAGGDKSATFTLTGNGAVSLVSAGATATIVLVGNGWYRCSVTYTAVSTGATGIRIYPQQFGTTGDGFSGIYIWGAQLEAGAFPTSYIPTTTAQVTRAADAASMTGVNFSSWYAAEQGTIYMEADGRQPNLTFSSANSGYANYRAVYRQFNTTGQVIRTAEINANVFSVNDIDLGPTNGLLFKAAYAYANNNFAGSVNGLAAITDISGQPALAVNRMGIGFDYGANATNTGLFKRITYYPQRLSNAELVEITAQG